MLTKVFVAAKTLTIVSGFNLVTTPWRAWAGAYGYSANKFGSDVLDGIGALPASSPIGQIVAYGEMSVEWALDPPPWEY